MRSRSRKCLMRRPWPNYSRICNFECRLDGMMHKWQVPPSSRSRLQFRYAVDIKLPITITGPQLLEVNYVNSPWLFERFNGGIPKSSSRHGWHGWPSIHVETHGDLGIHDFRWLQNPPHDSIGRCRFTDTGNFTLRCVSCQQGLKGEKAGSAPRVICRSSCNSLRFCMVAL